MIWSIHRSHRSAGKEPIHCGFASVKHEFKNTAFRKKQGFDGKKPNWIALPTNKHIPRPIKRLRRVWLIVAGRGSRVQSRGRGSNVAVAGPKSRSQVQCRGRENYLEFEVTERQRVIWKKYKGKKNRFYAWYSTVANLQVTDVTVNKVMSQEKTLKKKLADFCVRRKFILVSFYRAQLCINSALNVLMHNSIW